MINFQSLLGQGALLSMGPLGRISSDVNEMITPGKYVKPITTSTTSKTNELVLDPRTGTMISKDAPEGFNRGLYGFFDLFGGDRDKRGHGGGRKSDEGYGGINKNYEVDVGGKIKKKGPAKDPRTEIEKITGKKWDQYIKGQKDLMLEVGKEKFRQEQMARLPDLAHAAFGGSYATALQPGMANLAQVAAASRPYQFNSPAIRSSSINFASLLR